MAEVNTSDNSQMMNYIGASSSVYVCEREFLYFSFILQDFFRFERQIKTFCVLFLHFCILAQTGSDGHHDHLNWPDWVLEWDHKPDFHVSDTMLKSTLKWSGILPLLAVNPDGSAANSGAS